MSENNRRGGSKCEMSVLSEKWFHGVVGRSALPLAVAFALSGCGYKAPPDITSQSGASLTGIHSEAPSLMITYVAICANAIDGVAVNYSKGLNFTDVDDCSAPVLLTPGPHKLSLGVSFSRGGGYEDGSQDTTINVAAGKSYFIRADGGPMQFQNGNGTVSSPRDSQATVWIETSTGQPITPKMQISLNGPGVQNPIPATDQTLELVPILMMNR